MGSPVSVRCWSNTTVSGGRSDAGSARNATGGSSRTPAGATEYRCNNGRHFYARFLDNGASVWVIFPEREFRLDKAESASITRYTNRQTIFEVNESGEVSLRDGATFAYTGCTPGGAKPQPPKPKPEPESEQPKQAAPKD